MDINFCSLPLHQVRRAHRQHHRLGLQQVRRALWQEAGRAGPPPACGRGTEVSKDVLVADYKEPMIELLARVVRVSVETVTITEAMRGLDRAGWE